jgi:hypothetical protein
MNPFMMGPLAMSAWSNPDLFSTAMAAQGISPNAITNPNVPPGMDQMDPLAGFMTPSMTPQAAGAAPVADPAAAAPMAPGAAMALSGLGQVSAPKPTAPIMNAGVSGSQKAPEIAVGGQNSAMQAAIAKLLLNQQPGVTPVPGLPSLMKGII